MAKKTKRLSLGAVARHFQQLYGARNRAYNNSPFKMLAFMLVFTEIISRGARRGGSLPVIKHAVAALLGWWFALVNYFDNELAGKPIGYWIALKYPRQGCAYCHHNPCDCPPRRRQAKMIEPDPVQVRWSISQTQAHLKNLYGANNQASGIKDTIRRLFEEIAEVQKQVLFLEIGYGTIAQREREIGLELADIFAWIVAVANVLELDLEQVLMSHYSKRCPMCRELPCRCGKLKLERLLLPRRYSRLLFGKSAKRCRKVTTKKVA